MKIGALRKRPLVLALVALAAVALLALACEEEEKEATPAPGTPAATPGTPTALKPGAAGIASNPRQVRGLEGLKTPFVLDDGLAMWKTRPATEDRTGVTTDTIKLGRRTGITGFLASYEPGWGPTLAALIKRVNEAGGIHGRKIVLVTKDDKSTPQGAAEAVTDLVENEKVFALYFGVGAPGHSSTHEYHVEKKVPDLLFFDASGLGLEPVTSKWDIGYQPSDVNNGQMMARAVAKENPGAKIALVYADYPAPVAARNGIRYEAPKLGLEIVGEFAHDVQQVDLTAQARQVAETDADWVLYEGFQTSAVSLLKALRETVGWKGKIAQFGAITGDPGVEQVLDGTVNTSGGGISEEWYPDDPLWARLKALAKDEGYTYTLLNASSMGAFEILVRALELAGPDLTREGLMEAFDNGFTLQDNWKCNACQGPVIFGPQDHWPYESWRAGRWNNATRRWTEIDAASFETSEGKGLRGNLPGFECKPPSADAPKGTCPWKQ